MAYAINLSVKDYAKLFPWDSNFAYAIGLLVTDGNLSKDGRHFEFTSKDMEQIRNFMRCLKLHVKISLKSSGYTGTRVPHLQFGNVRLYRYLETLGIHPAKSKTIGELDIPNEWFFDFLRGHFDGDGSSYSYWDKRWRSSFMYYLTFNSASPIHLRWLRERLRVLLGVQGHITKARKQSVEQLKYAKREANIILKKMYPNPKVVCLTRKRLKILRALATIGRTVETSKTRARVL
ncbi:MAG: hypothetical protein Q8O51_00585 [bacterium]|nr:hypothetical protein [bacterium]